MLVEARIKNILDSIDTKILLWYYNYKRKKQRRKLKMTKAKTVVAVHTHTVRPDRCLV